MCACVPGRLTSVWGWRGQTRRGAASRVENRRHFALVLTSAAQLVIHPKTRSKQACDPQPNAFETKPQVLDNGNKMKQTHVHLGCLTLDEIIHLLE